MSVATAKAARFSVEDCVIISTNQGNQQQEKAVAELQKHLELVLGKPVPVLNNSKVPPKGRYPFFVGKAASYASIASQEVRWKVAPEGTYLYGDQPTGALFAVYAFLEDQLGIRWVEPGDVGISFTPQSPLQLNEGEFHWRPKLVFRSLRQGIRKIDAGMAITVRNFPGAKEFSVPAEVHNARVDSVVEWRGRMRMGGTRPAGGHAFANWWKRFGATHPDYFALTQYGKREPVPLAKADQTNEFTKICVSNPRVVEQIIADWLPTKDRRRMVDTGVNDGIENFCECERCRALDVPLDGEKFPTHLTDRYVCLSNAVAREARKHRPDAYVAMYAYLTTLYPPRREKLEPNVLVQLVPYVDPLDIDTVKAHIEGWTRAGAMEIAFRPNYHTKYMTAVLPLGIEKQMYEVLQVAIENRAVSAEYDSIVNNWPVTGMTDYILARTMVDPSKPFSHWEQEYCATFGEAAPEVLEYFRHWREQVWEQRLKPNINRIANVGGAGDFCRGLLWTLDKYYQPSDFEAARAILDRAAAKPLRAEQADRLEQLRLANEHALLAYRAIAASPQDKSPFGEELMAFRRENRDKLRLQWPGIISGEIGNGDLTGLLIGDEMKAYQKPWVRTDLFWKFQLDPKDVGLKEKWHQKTLQQLGDWHDFRTDRPWEKQYEFDEPNPLPEAVARLISTYDGVAWYATQSVIPAQWQGEAIFLRFGAVDESCQVYVNGKLAGERIYRDRNDWKTPFEIQIDPHIDWSQEKQQITVRVTDESGSGGIWRPVWIVSKK